jgi:hypothetical protein
LKRETTIRPLTVVCVCFAAALLLPVAAFVGCHQTGKTISLRFKYEPGMQYSYQLTKKSSSSMMEADSAIFREVRNATKLIYDLVSGMADDSTAEIVETSEARYNLIVRNDSTVVDTNTYHSEVVLHLRPNGKVVNFEFPGNRTDNSLEYYKDLYQQGYPVFPSGELSRGHSWTQTTTVMLDDGPSEASTTYELRSFVRERGYDCVVIAYDGSLVIPVESTVTDSFTVSGVNHTEFTGVMYFAYKEGMVVSTRNHWTVEGHRRESASGNRVRKYRLIQEGDDNLVLLERKPFRLAEEPTTHREVDPVRP